MEREEDAQLVHAVLAGDDTAFDILVEKYQKSVHAFMWQKIGDFHYAEEITQDTFLRAYQKLSTLRNPSQFLGWLLVIGCTDRKKMQGQRMVGASPWKSGVSGGGSGNNA